MPCQMHMMPHRVFHRPAKRGLNTFVASISSLHVTKMGQSCDADRTDCVEGKHGNICLFHGSQVNAGENKERTVGPCKESSSGRQFSDWKVFGKAAHSEHTAGVRVWNSRRHTEDEGSASTLGRCSAIARLRARTPAVASAPCLRYDGVSLATPRRRYVAGSTREQDESHFETLEVPSVSSNPN